VYRARTRAFDVGVAAINQVRNAPLREPGAQQRAITIAERMIEDGSRQPVVFNEGEGVVQRIGRGQRGTGSFELSRDIHDDKGLILNDED
jgi:hypothetical protein